MTDYHAHQVSVIAVQVSDLRPVRESCGSFRSRPKFSPHQHRIPTNSRATASTLGLPSSPRCRIFNNCSSHDRKQRCASIDIRTDLIRVTHGPLNTTTSTAIFTAYRAILRFYILPSSQHNKTWPHNAPGRLRVRLCAGQTYDVESVRHAVQLATQYP